MDKSTAAWTPVRILPWVRNDWRIPEEADELSWAAGLCGIVLRHSDRDPSVKVRLYRDMVEVPENHASTIWFGFHEVEALDEWSDEYWDVIHSMEAWAEGVRLEFNTSLRVREEVGI